MSGLCDLTKTINQKSLLFFIFYIYYVLLEKKTILNILTGKSFLDSSEKNGDQVELPNSLTAKINITKIIKLFREYNILFWRF